MGYSDTDVAEYLFKAKPLIDALVKFLCNDLTKACAIEPPPVPKVLSAFDAGLFLLARPGYLAQAQEWLNLSKPKLSNPSYYRRPLYGDITHMALLVDAVGTLLVPSQPTAQIC
uniref:Uncharacterized protein n=1 Tax=Nelumbo nucifera TaxID=4432 RepID=A0A822Y2F4_NELNU|nr:TPA_asm: hypothetical protein HUJ06_029552 [Nelumbo nucifera]